MCDMFLGCPFAETWVSVAVNRDECHQNRKNQLADHYRDHPYSRYDHDRDPKQRRWIK
jgi:hypothetical protein